MTTSSVTYTIKEEEGGIQRLRLEIGIRRLHVVYVPRTDSTGWRVGYSTVYRNTWGDPQYPRHFILHGEEEFSRNYTPRDFLVQHLNSERVSEGEIEAVGPALDEFLGLVPS